MTIRYKLILRLLALFLAFGSVFVMHDLIQNRSFSGIREVVFFITFPFTLYIFAFIIPTIRIYLKEEGITVYWKVGIGPIKLWEQKNYKLLWSEIKSVSCTASAWFPIKLVSVNGMQGKTWRRFFIGSVVTKNKQSLLFIANHVSSKILDLNVQDIIKKYRSSA